MKVTFVVRVLDGVEIIGAYLRKMDIPFVPTIGMKFKQSSSTRLWETIDGDELEPAVKEVVYNLDEQEIFCLFEIDRLLASSFWTQAKNLSNNYELSQFEVYRT